MTQLATPTEASPTVESRTFAGGNNGRRPSNDRPVRIALVSFLFNWPSTGGGIIHTVELARFLSEAGFEVRLIHPVYNEWQIGLVDSTCPFPTVGLEFNQQNWNRAAISRAFRQAVDDFPPDHVLITDCWNFKPHLAHALSDYSVMLRMQAQECLCPLNNLRLLPDGDGGVWQCDNSQLRTPTACGECLGRYGGGSGSLHRAERELAGVGSPEYDALLRQALRDATAVLTLNPHVSELYRPYCRRVETVTWGMDPQRFPSLDDQTPERNRRTQILFAGLASEPIKGFAVVRAACARLWEKRQDFELVATCDPIGPLEPFLRFVGWQSQAQLPVWYRKAGLCVVPTIAQDGLSRTAVEAAASGTAVLGSRLGGLPYSLIEGETGLLCEPANVDDWAAKIDRLLDAPLLRSEMGQAGRRMFEERFSWPTVIERDYVPLLSRRRASRGWEAIR